MIYDITELQILYRYTDRCYLHIHPQRGRLVYISIHTLLAVHTKIIQRIMQVVSVKRLPQNLESSNI